MKLLKTTEEVTCDGRRCKPETLNSCWHRFLIGREKNNNKNQIKIHFSHSVGKKCSSRSYRTGKEGNERNNSGNNREGGPLCHFLSPF